jgi:hypothetical protein
MVRAPEGFRRVGSVANAPWFNLKKGNILLGNLQNVYERPDDRAKSGKSNFYQIETLEPVEARLGRGEEAKVVMVGKGVVVNLNWGPKTKELEKFVPEVLRGAIYRVWVSVGDKFKISKGRTMWDLDVQIQLVKASAASEDDLDFSGEGEEASAATAS